MSAISNEGPYMEHVTCSNCGMPFRREEEFCSHCGAGGLAVVAASATQQFTIDGHVPLGEDKKTRAYRSFLGISIRIGAVLLWTGFLAVMRYSFSAEGFGAWLGLMFGPLSIAYLIAKATNKSNFSYWFFALGIVIPALSMPKSLTSLSHADLVKELTGTKPLEHGLSASERKIASIAKDLLAQMNPVGAKHDQEIAAIAPDFGQLYTAGSFSSRDAIQKSLDAVDTRLSADKELLSRLESMPQVVQDRLAESSLSENDKKTFFSEFMSSFGSSDYLSARQEMMRIELAWADSTKDLYSFALLRVPQIEVVQDKLLIPNTNVREEFNSKLARAETLYEEFNDSATKVDRIREAYLKREGISPTDIGINK